MIAKKYIDAYYVVSSQKVGTHLPVNSIVRLNLNIILFTISWVEGSTSLHQVL